MAIFYDDFERANGSLGGNWTTDVGSMSITGGYATAGASSGMAYNTTVSDSGKHKATCLCAWVSSGSLNAGPIIKMDPSNNGGYGAYLVFSTPNYVLYLTKGSWGRGTLLNSANVTTTQPFTWTIEIEYENGVVTARCAGVEVSAEDVEYAGNEYAGVYGINGNARIADFRFVAGADPTFAVSPDVIGNYGSTSSLTFSGGNTDWTAGTPGTPTFTVDHGTLSDQEVVDADTATATYDPGDYLGAVVFTDPSTGATATALVTSNPNTVPPFGTWLSQDAVDYIERSAVAEQDAYILNTTTLVGGVGEQAGASVTLGDLRLSAYKNTYTLEGYSSTAKLLYLLYGVLSGFSPLAEIFDAPTTTTSVKQDTEQSLDLLATLTDQGTISLVDALAQLGGDPIASNRDIMTAIAAIEGGDNQDVLDALAVIRGDESTTLAGIATLVQAISTIAGYDLSDVLDAIALIPTNPITSLSPVTDKLDLIQPSNSITLSSISLDVGSVAGDLADLALEVAAVKEIVQDILAALASGPTPPVWPGVENVTLGTEVALSDALEITGPMDGVVITITSQPVQAGRYRFGSVSSWTHVGAIMFGSDRGDYERPESFSIDTQVVCPRTMQSAASCIIRLNSGWGGTIRPWTRAA